MKKFVALLVAIGFCAALLSCVTGSAGILDRNKVDSITPGRTDKSELVGMFGLPEYTSPTKNGVETVRWSCNDHGTVYTVTVVLDNGVVNNYTIDGYQ